LASVLVVEHVDVDVEWVGKMEEAGRVGEQCLS
jgi:hypothetical protein